MANLVYTFLNVVAVFFNYIILYIDICLYTHSI